MSSNFYIAQICRKSVFKGLPISGLAGSFRSFYCGEMCKHNGSAKKNNDPRNNIVNHTYRFPSKKSFCFRIAFRISILAVESLASGGPSILSTKK